MCDFVGNCLDVTKLTPEEVECLEKWLQERNDNLRALVSFTDKEKINLEIYAERQNDATVREAYLEMAQRGDQTREQEAPVSRGR